MPASTFGHLARGLAVCAIALLLAGGPLGASRVRPVNLEELALRAERILAGRTLEVDVETDPASGLLVTRVTVAVDRPLKGDLGDRVTFRMLGDARADSAGFAPGLPRFAAGEELILFLGGESGLGLTSPIGLVQGKLRVARDKSGRAIAIGPLGNATLLGGLSEDVRLLLGGASAEGRGIDAVTLLGVVEALVERRGAPAPPEERP